MAEKYGVYAQLIESLASTPVDTSTNIVFIGSAKINALDEFAKLDLVNRPIYISSQSDFEKKLGGGSASDGFTLAEAAEACFSVVGISGAYFINTYDGESESVEPSLSDATKKALESVFTTYGAVPNLICLPGVTDVSKIAQIEEWSKKINGHFDAFVVFDVVQSSEQVANGQTQTAKVTNAAKYENAVACWPSVKTAKGNIISAAAVVCALYAKNDANNNDIPVRSIGNTDVSILDACLSGGTSVDLSETDATEIQGNGIITFLNVGGGSFVTWGDHTAAYSVGGNFDERARYDSNMRVLMLLTNRFQQKYRFSIDKPMTLTMRNDIIQEENDYLSYLQSVGAIVGDATCQFLAEDNSEDDIAQGQFVWSIAATVTPPMKYAQLNVAFTTDGYSVYYE